MFNETAFETLESFGESLESTEWNEMFGENLESAEWSPKRNQPLQRPKFGNAVAKSVANGYATKAELTATANRLDARIAVNTKGIASLESGLKSLGAAHNRLEHTVKKEIEERKQVTDGLRQSIENMKMAVMLTPVISAPKTVLMNGEKVMVDSGDNFSTLLPMLLLSGSFGPQPAGGTAQSSNDMMMPLLILAMGRK
ncbi:MULTISPECIES: hypothetical protein [unclassified Sphingomonas]|uniref:hypothetical protein n=1 Tax=unclassified Sphingomonas TaxID=196159 RepID=UPI001F5884FB|nr:MULTISPECIES: hypothetical protein [unclassified Sphingomonas]